MHNGEIECPWHRSRFDMRTGRVTQGPAKENLKIFSAKILDGKIAVELAASQASEQRSNKP
jgi:nitrite reductase/ring-hydroxylating ferredoxin subunit